MIQIQKDELIAEINKLGAGTRSAVLISVDHEGSARIVTQGGVVDIGFQATVLQWFMGELLSGRAKLSGEKPEVIPDAN